MQLRPVVSKVGAIYYLTLGGWLGPRKRPIRHIGWVMQGKCVVIEVGPGRGEGQ